MKGETVSTLIPRTSRTRPLTIMAQDPTVTDIKGPLLTQVDVPAEQLADGPSGYRVRVVDYDSSTGTLYRPAEQKTEGSYEDPFWGRDVSELVENPHFHQQNVYAIAMRVLGRFEFALGRHVSWQFETHQLKLVPHAFREKNAFYSRGLESLLFGYYAPEKRDRPRSGRVYTCLSHDVVAHETTHALLDGLRERFLLPSLPDQSAFHEGFADIVAILSVASLPDLVETVMSQRKNSDGANGSVGCHHAKQTFIVRRADAGDGKSIKEMEDTIEAAAPIFSVAEQMGRDDLGVRGDGLRNSLRIAPDRNAIHAEAFQEPHRRGELLVAAVLRAVVRITQGRCLRIGVPCGSAYSEAWEVSNRQMAECVAEAARDVLTIAIRALDYLHPVHVTFDVFLTAMLTADYELVGDDSRYEYRRIIRESFEDFGILPASSEKNGLWPRADLAQWIRLERTDHHAMMFDRDEMFRFVWENRGTLGLSDAYYTIVSDVSPVVRVGPDGMLLSETVVEYIQSTRLSGRELVRAGFICPEQMDCCARTNLYGGGTLIFDSHGQLKYHIASPLDDRGLQSKRLKYLYGRRILQSGMPEVVNSLSSMHEERMCPRVDTRNIEELW